MSEACPKCGLEWTASHGDWWQYACGSEANIPGRATFHQTAPCEAIEELRATNERLCAQLFSAVLGNDIDTEECGVLLEAYSKEQGY